MPTSRAAEFALHRQTRRTPRQEALDAREEELEGIAEGRSGVDGEQQGREEGSQEPDRRPCHLDMEDLTFFDTSP
jgi:hypothetical protein